MLNITQLKDRITIFDTYLPDEFHRAIVGFGGGKGDIIYSEEACGQVRATRINAPNSEIVGKGYRMYLLPLSTMRFEIGFIVEEELAERLSVKTNTFEFSDLTDLPEKPILVPLRQYEFSTRKSWQYRMFRDFLVEHRPLSSKEIRNRIEGEGIELEISGPLRRNGLRVRKSRNGSGIPTIDIEKLSGDLLSEYNVVIAFIEMWDQLKKIVGESIEQYSYKQHVDIQNIGSSWTDVYIRAFDGSFHSQKLYTSSPRGFVMQDRIEIPIYAVCPLIEYWLSLFPITNIEQERLHYSISVYESEDGPMLENPSIVFDRVSHNMDLLIGMEDEEE